MTAAAATSAPEPQADAWEAEAQARAVAQRQLQVLGRLAEIGLSIAGALEQQVTAEGAKLAAGDAALAYARVSRAVRLSLALQSSVLEGLQALDRAAGSRLYEQRCKAERDRQLRAQAHRERVDRVLDRVIEKEATSEAEGERLAGEAHERLERDDIYGDLAERSVSEIIDRVCRDLGLSPDWPSLAQEAWAQEEIEARTAAAPLAALGGPDPPAAPRRKVGPRNTRNTRKTLSQAP
ncbi:hypothetical protein LJR225_004187 [Phenylobacterium sp. LjRoot225]|uniref:hypothetical protein n=1 Tax=Phenylobacterium sp. LjRoot225 TaxID=3342285 RepID=UPI003ECEA203